MTSERLAFYFISEVADIRIAASCTKRGNKALFEKLNLITSL